MTTLYRHCGHANEAPYERWPSGLCGACGRAPEAPSLKHDGWRPDGDGDVVLRAPGAPTVGGFRGRITPEAAEAMADVLRSSAREARRRAGGGCRQRAQESLR